MVASIQCALTASTGGEDISEVIWASLNTRLEANDDAHDPAAQMLREDESVRLEAHQETRPMSLTHGDQPQSLPLHQGRVLARRHLR